MGHELDLGRWNHLENTLLSEKSDSISNPNIYTMDPRTRRNHVDFRSEN